MNISEKMTTIALNQQTVYTAEKNAEYVGRIEKVLVDGPSKTNSRTYGGRTETFKLVNFRGSPEMIGQIVDVKITASNTFSLEGEVI